jgi:aspartyl-tRNA(Asn)/glutamyl-tRNA(Gln) amidotransferase subunit C
MTKITSEQIRKIADLANLEMSSEEAEKMHLQMNELLEMLEPLTSVDTTNIEPMIFPSNSKAR